MKLRSYFINVIYQNMQRVYKADALTTADAICMAIDMMEREGVDLRTAGMMSIVAKPDDAANSYMAQFDRDHFINGEYEVIPCAA